MAAASLMRTAGAEVAAPRARPDTEDRAAPRARPGTEDRAAPREGGHGGRRRIWWSGGSAGPVACRHRRAVGTAARPARSRHPGARAARTARRRRAGFPMAPSTNGPGCHPTDSVVHGSQDFVVPAGGVCTPGLSCVFIVSRSFGCAQVGLEPFVCCDMPPVFLDAVGNVGKFAFVPGSTVASCPKPSGGQDLGARCRSRALVPSTVSAVPTRARPPTTTSAAALVNGSGARPAPPTPAGTDVGARRLARHTEACRGRHHSRIRAKPRRARGFRESLSAGSNPAGVAVPE